MSHPLIARAEDHESDMLSCLRMRKATLGRSDSAPSAAAHDSARRFLSEAADHAAVAVALRAWAAREPAP